VPLDGRALDVAPALPGDLATGGFEIAQTSGEALADEDGQFAFGDVQPATVLGRVVELETSGNPPRLGGRERHRQRRDGVHVEVVEYDANDGGVRLASSTSHCIWYAKSTAVRRCVTSMWRQPVSGSTVVNRLHVPLRRYS
jgi:hypothetical protein